MRGIKKAKVARRWTLFITLLIAVVGGGGRPSRAAGEPPQPLFNKAEALYSEGEFEKAGRLYREFLQNYPSAPETARLTALEHGGISAALLGREEEARGLFLQLLAIKPTHRLDELYVLPEVVRFYESVRADYFRANPLPSPRRKMPLYLSLLPMGVGQIYNDQPAKGYSLMAAETTAIGLSFFSYTKKRSYCTEWEGSVCLTQAPDKHDRWETVQRASAFLASGLFIYGFVDGILFHSGEESLLSLSPYWIPHAEGNPAAGGLALEWRY